MKFPTSASSRRQAAAHVALVASLLMATLCPPRAFAASPSRPNVIFILVDDLRWDDLGCAGHPFVKSPHIDRLAREGARFLNAFMTTPLCSPSRATFLTGQYAHTHGITDNTDRRAASHALVTFPRLLREAGYETGFIGKWHMGNDATPRPGFDLWLGMPGQGKSNDPELNENGRPIQLRGYTTDLFNARAVEFVRKTRDRPFLLYLSHKAIHPETEQRADGSISDPSGSNFIPAPRHRQLYDGMKIPRRPNALAAPQGKPALERRIGDLPPLGPATGGADETILNRLRMLAAVDEGVGQILEALSATGQLDRTLIMLAGDNGYFYGEHGLSVERRLAYEESVRMPLLVRHPGLAPAGSTPTAMVLNLDVAPSLLDAAGVAPPAAMQGHSFLPLLRGESVPWRDSFLIEYWSDKVFPRVANMGYRALRNQRWKFIHYLELPGMDELYDLQTDPYEMHNLIQQPSAQEPLRTLQAELQGLLQTTGAR